MRPYIIFMCLCLLALAVSVPAEENTETELDSPRSQEDLLPVREGTKLDGDINIDGANKDDDDTGTNREENADPTDDEETNYNGGSDNEGYEEDDDNKNYNEDYYGDDKDAKADEEEPAPEETEKANTGREGFSPNEGGSLVAQGTGDINDAAGPVSAQGTSAQSGAASTSNIGSSKAEGASTNQEENFQKNGANKDPLLSLPPLPGDGISSAQSNSRGSSGPGPQASQGAGAVAANALAALPPLLPVSSSNSQNGQSNPSPITGPSDSRAPVPADSGSSNTGAAGAVPSSDTSNLLATNTQALLPPLGPNNNLASVNTLNNLPPLGPNNNLAPVNTLNNLPPLGSNNNLPPLNPAPKDLPSLFPNSNPAPVNPDTPKVLPPLFPNSNPSPVNSGTPNELPPLISNSNIAPANPGTPNVLPPLMPNNSMAPPVNSPGNTAGGPASFQQPRLPNIPFSGGVAGQSSYANKLGMTGDQNLGQSSYANKLGMPGDQSLGQSSYANKVGMTGDQNLGQSSYANKLGMPGDQNPGQPSYANKVGAMYNPLASSLGGQNSALSGAPTQNLGSKLAPGPVILPSGPTKIKSDGLEFPNEAKPSPTAVFGRDDIGYQTRLRTTVSPWRGFGDLTTAPTSRLQISQGDMGTGGDDPETSEEDPERERPQHHEDEDYQYNNDDDLGDEELPPTEPGDDDGDWYDSRENQAQSQEVGEGETGDKAGKATSDNDDNTDDYYEDDYMGKGNAEGGTDEKSFQSQYQDPGHNVLEEPKSGGESRAGSEDVETGALDMTTVKTKAPNKPTNMVLFYTWLILVVLIAVVTISTCKTRIVGLFNRAKKSASHQRPPEEGKRLLEHEYV